LNEHHDFAALQVLSKATALAKRPFEVVHCEFGPLGNAALVLRICGAITGPILTSFRGSDISTYPKRKPRVYALLKKKGTAFLPVCDAFNPLLIGMGFPKERIATYRSSISLEAFPLRPFVPMARNSVSLLCVGRFVAKKGFEHAISVTSRLRSKGIQARLILIGDGPERAALQATAERAGISSFVDMPGWIRHEEIASSLRDCDVFLGTSVTPSSGELEGIPNVLKEAMAVGVPIVAFDHSGVREIVIDGKTGHLVPERDEEAMVERIDRLLKDSTERERIILAARRFVEETYGRESLAKAAEAIYSSFTDDKLPDGYHGKQ
jgi:colanic acid/amylovoran biosynthesis glycosyltransferase